jgi:fibro-slime domain-containing protein
MSWSVKVRVLGVCGLWLLALQGCGGNPSVDVPTGGSSGAETSGGKGGNGTSGSSSGGLDIMPIGGTDGTGGSDMPQPTYVCGNQELEPGEFCDDGNTEDEDGCSADCATVDGDFDCSVVGEPCVQVVICGNGVLEGDELCDDKNTDDDDGCAADCSMPEDGFVCIRPGEPCVEISVCGNGVRQRGEACDDGQLPPVAGDGCDDLCQIEASYFCPIPGQLCVKQVCGDGVKTPGEVCDDGNTDAGDGCSANCQMVEAGWHCNAMGCKPECGDGLVRGVEACDDNNAIGGDGCSSGCKVEPYFKCTKPANAQSACTPALTAAEACLNNQLDPIFTGNVITGFEKCSPKDVNGCNSTCTDFVPQTSDPAVCGNSIVEAGEECDRPAADPGCSATCQVENGYNCPPVGACVLEPFCGDNTVDFALGEECDPPKVNMGCSASCKVESGWNCSGLGPSTCVRPVCGNGVVDPKTATSVAEQCDDGTPGAAVDGCAGCILNPDFVCPAAGQPCLPRCGDGKKVGIEQCDDGNKLSGDGCNAGCKIEPGKKCPTPGAACVDSVCGDDIDDAGEGCDDGNLIAGDGCGPTCQKEPTVTLGPSPTVNVFCGDGLKTGSEDCDDGNVVDGDGCDSGCEVENGWSCSGDLDLPSSLRMRVTYRDFKVSGATNGHPHFENSLADDKGIAGQPCTTANQASCGRLDSGGKPQTAGGFSSIPGGAGASTAPARFSTWYRDTNTLGFDTSVVTDALTLTQVGGATSEVYEYQSAAQFPINGRGFGNTCGTELTGGCCNTGGVCLGRNYSFTTELRYFFQYQGGETLTFRGDDDVWVFINGRLAVDVGGVHCAQIGKVILGDTDSSCSLHGADYTNNFPGGNFSAAACVSTGDPPACALTAGEQGGTTDSRFGLTKGNVYEIVLFHAERHTTDSNFRLTLAGFLAPRSFCESDCGDGIVVGDEFCDDGASNSDTVAGACRTDCTSRNFCGDKAIQSPEQCDDGSNITTYKTAQTPAGACAPGCKTPASCGDGVQQSGQGEQCDNGGANNNNAYGDGSCKTNCTLGGYCGDGTTNGSEICDLGVDNGQTYGTSSCTYDCKPGPRCGDGVLAKGFEACDDGANNGTAASHCSTTCTVLPYCGDGIKQNGEECDFGQFASTEYGGCKTECLFGPHCGDGGPGNTPDPEEECDYGTAGNNGSYNGCTSKCGLGPRCGDGVLQSNEGEVCDNGFNADDYNDPNTPQEECGMNCTAPPFCGDGVLQPAYELCDYGACENDDDPTCNRPLSSDKSYQGCTDKCEFGPYCGDGVQQSMETCDDGLDNVSYLPEMGGCGYDCQLAPYCGDGERNGPEQCDNGAMNTGEYGMCNPDCTFGDRCGDGVKQGPEECDDGQTGSLTCTPTCKRRIQVQ